MLIKNDMGNQNEPYRLVRVPRNIEISPLIESHSENQQPELSCNYNIPKAIIAIIQMGYGAYELYMGSDRQIEKFGYTAYSLTVIPYILLSFVNLLATLCQPQYPAMFLIYYKVDGAVYQARGAELDAIKVLVSGAVGEASGVQPDHGFIYEAQRRGEKNLKKEWLLRIISLLLFISVLAGPYLIINATTGFENGQSTKAQRVWLICWLVAGQIFGGVAPRNVSAFKRLCLLFLAAVLVCPAAVGGFIVVAKMILDDVVCKTL